MHNGDVLFFDNDDHGWWVKDLLPTPTGWRGYVADGCFWLDYNGQSGHISICTCNISFTSKGSVNWDQPINVIKNRTLVEIIPVDLNTQNYLEISAWANLQRANKLVE